MKQPLFAFVRIVDALSEFTGRLAGWMFFAIGLFVTFEVFMRYVLIMPTIWVDEISRIFQVWAAYLAIAYVLKHRQHIVIDIAFRDVHTKRRLFSETFSIAVILLFSAVAVKYGFDIWLKSTLAGHTTDSYLAVPKLYIESSIWVGFGLLALQALAELVKVWTGTSAIHNADLLEHS